MAATRLALAALRLPWKDLLKAAPIILRASGELVTRLADRQRGLLEHAPSVPVDNATLMMRLDALERAGESQAELTKALADQIKEVSDALRSMAIRILFGLGCSLLALLLAAIALVRTFF
jgi:hypothetical protein